MHKGLSTHGAKTQNLLWFVMRTWNLRTFIFGCGLSLGHLYTSRRIIKQRDNQKQILADGEANIENSNLFLSLVPFLSSRLYTSEITTMPRISEIFKIGITWSFPVTFISKSSKSFQGSWLVLFIELLKHALSVC